METINERFARVIEESGRKIKDVSEAIGISSPALSQICSGKSNPSNQTILLFCGKMGVDEVWLRTGEGVPFRQQSREEQIAEILGKAIKSQGARSVLLRALCMIPEEAFEDFLDHVVELARRIEEERGEK